MDTPSNPPSLFLSRAPMITAVVAGLILVLVIAYLVFLRPQYSLLYDDLRPSEAAALVAELDKQGIRYRLEDGGGAILAPKAEIDAIRLRMASSDAPLGAEHGFELFDENDLGLTDFAQKVRYQRALQGELSRTIMMMDGVSEARVHLSIPERTLFRGERRNAEAAVTLVMRAAEDETPARIAGVQRLVAAAVMDLSVDDVVVLNARGEVISAPPSDIAAIADNAARNGVDSISADSVARLLRNILADVAFEVSIQRMPPTLAGASVEDSATVDQTVVHIITAETLSGEHMERVMQALEDAAILNPAAGRSVSFRVEPIASTQVEAAADIGTDTPHTARLSQNVPSTPSPYLLAGLVLGLLGLAALVIVMLRRRVNQPMTPEERAQFADHLKAALQPHEEPSHG